MKYLVHELGVDRFRQLVESYTGKKVQPWREIPEWKYSDWLGWHEQGDGKWFLGVSCGSRGGEGGGRIGGGLTAVVVVLVAVVGVVGGGRWRCWCWWVQW